MTSRDLVYWLQGFAEIHGGPPTAEQWETIKRHLNMVFVHEIDPSMPDPNGKLQEAHGGAKPPAKVKPEDMMPWTGGHRPDPLIRC